jgi:hypothetical protein
MKRPNTISLHGAHINLFVERGPVLGPVLEVPVADVEEAKRRPIEKRMCDRQRSVRPDL